MSTLDEHARAGIQALQEQRIEDAITAFSAALDLDDSRPDLNHALGMAYLQRGEVGSALPRLERAVELSEPYDHPDHQAAKRDFRENLALAYRLADRPKDSIQILEGTIERWPDEVNPRILLGQLLFATGRIAEALGAYDKLAAIESLGAEQKLAAFALTGAVRAYEDAEHEGKIFLEAHQGSYKSYFDEVTAGPVSEGWYAEASRMARGDDGEVRPYLPEGARPYALIRVDLVNPTNGEVGSVYSEREPMIVALNGLEPLAQAQVVFPWSGWDFEVGVSSVCPWHWLTLMFEFADRSDEALAALDDVIGDWYLAGYNGEFGDAETGRFHYVTDPDPVGERTVTYTFDLGRASFDAIPALLRRLTILHGRYPLNRVVFGQAVIAE
ncbi:MAG: tetratricopeptide repeat protein [Deltaproteobacteria bacterium]|nr:MAG: tetratricopeptide repeat protein [Deltaproteobacteria bacterium]